MAMLIAEIGCGESGWLCRSSRLAVVSLMAMLIVEVDCMSLMVGSPALDAGRPTWAL